MLKIGLVEVKLMITLRSDSKVGREVGGKKRKATFIMRQQIKSEPKPAG